MHGMHASYKHDCGCSLQSSCHSGASSCQQPLSATASRCSWYAPCIGGQQKPWAQPSATRCPYTSCAVCMRGRLMARLPLFPILSRYMSCEQCRCGYWSKSWVWTPIPWGCKHEVVCTHGLKSSSQEQTRTHVRSRTQSAARKFCPCALFLHATSMRPRSMAWTGTRMSYEPCTSDRDSSQRRSFPTLSQCTTCVACKYGHCLQF